MNCRGAAHRCRLEEDAATLATKAHKADLADLASGMQKLFSDHLRQNEQLLQQLLEKTTAESFALLRERLTGVEDRLALLTEPTVKVDQMSRPDHATHGLKPSGIDRDQPVEEQSAFLVGQPVRLKGLKAERFNGSAGLVANPRGADGRFGILLWSESVTKAILPRNLEQGGPEPLNENCADCGGQVCLNVFPPCRCSSESRRIRLLEQFKSQLGFSSLSAPYSSLNR